MSQASPVNTTDADGEWVERHVETVNPLGFHVRPAQKVAGVANRFRSEVLLQLRGQDVNAKSTVHLMVLSAVQGTPFVIRARGEDAEAAVAAVAKLFEDGFDEMEPEDLKP